MSKLFLTSYFAEVAELIGDCGVELKGRRVVFIPTASLHEEVNFYVEDAKQAFERLGVVVDELEVSTASANEIKDKLQASDYIYVTGGNTFFLLQELKRSGADKFLLEQIKLGKTYIGESAGSIILSADIAYIQEMDTTDPAKDLKSYKGLNLVDFYPLPHYGNQPFKETAERTISRFENEINLRPFSNNQVICVTDGRVKILTLEA
ncbi:Type 1 glutamine amidotransferase-like domain-containing protein [Microbulbifer sp. ZKSA006]|uniref:Type 1 glutamine amidotransferase-like domain-containing protein n=1 Tax=Microbulbifer sp. ZKSA006 TaxID=3243390 RepID=UPI0040394D1B